MVEIIFNLYVISSTLLYMILEDIKNPKLNKTTLRTDHVTSRQSSITY